MASYYRDLRLHGKHIIFNVEAMVNLGIPVWKFFFLGHVGPFCNLHEEVFIEENKYPLIPPTTINFGISHDDKERGAEIWCLFMYDTILSMNKRALSTTDDSTIVFGSHTHTQSYLTTKKMTPEMRESENINVMYLCGLLRDEMSAVIQRLRFVFLEKAKHPSTQLTMPKDWGMERDFIRELRTSHIYHLVVKPVLDASRNEKNKPEPTYKLEKHFRNNINDSSKNAPLASVNYIMESALFAIFS
jgi:hypothetical protein